nr:hypothetical protein [Tanacetum cinerariifolium]
MKCTHFDEDIPNETSNDRQALESYTSSFGLVIVLPGRVLETKDEAAEESGVDKPELGKLELDRLVPGKLEVGFNLGTCSINVLSIANDERTIEEGMRTTTIFSAAISASEEEEVIEIDDSLLWAEVSQSL